MGKSRRTDQLTERETEVLSLIRLGLTNEDIAERLGERDLIDVGEPVRVWAGFADN